MDELFDMETHEPQIESAQGTERLCDTPIPTESQPVRADDKVWLGFDLGGTKMNAVLFDSHFESIARRRKKTRGFEGASAGIERIGVLIDKVLEEAVLADGGE